jgi:endonuclease YncB( thermonuclease family)
MPVKWFARGPEMQALMICAAVAAVVLSVVDGDTLNVDRGAGKERVILYGVDCPELDQPVGTDARKFTDERCYKKTVQLDERGKDKRGRVIANITLPDGTNLNEELVRRGLAWWSDKYAPKDTKLKGLQAAAQAAHAGVWSAPDPVAPWVWRNGQKAVQAKVMPAAK